MANTTTSRTGYQAIMLLRLRKEFGIDTSEAQALSGKALDDWIEAQSDELFEREHAEFKAMRANQQH